MQKWNALIVALAVTLSAPLLDAADTSRRHRIVVPCSKSPVQVRIFDDNGKSIFEYSAPVSDRGVVTAAREDRESVEGKRRYAATSASKGCVQGISGRDPDTYAPVNEFEMSCNSDEPVDFVIKSHPRATFKIRREIRAKSGTTCFSESDLEDGSSISSFTSDEKLIIDAYGVDDSLMSGHLELDWNRLPRSRTVIPNRGHAGQGGSGRAANADKVRKLTSFTIEPRPR